MPKHPTLRRTMIVNLGLMVLASLVIGAASIVAVRGLHQDLGSAVAGYRQLRQLFDVGFLASKAREDISATPPQPKLAVAALQSAMSSLNQRSDAASVDGPPARWLDESARNDCRRLLADCIDHLNGGSPNPAALNLLFAELSKTADNVRQAIANAQKAADLKQRLTMASILSLNSVVIFSAIVIGIRQYRRVIRPIHQISGGVRDFAGGRLDRRIDIRGDGEFIALAADFNRMAEELSALYRDLEAKVAVKSRELVRSQRLAGVGYLAAGVAHEINNPLGIIAGYSERALQRIAQTPDEALLSHTQNALRVICEETFRCKQITERLLSLARPGAENRQVISLGRIAEAVVSTLSGLGTLGGRQLILHFDSDADLRVVVNEGELKQLLLNLVLNAIDAVDQNQGQIQLNLCRVNLGRTDQDEIELSVKDNGHGMDADTMDRIFQPFFSRKPGVGRGTGLGLCIAQAIAAEHGGVIQAKSDGPETGSTFTLRLPAAPSSAEKEAVVASL
jgi:signal transduction histidine kinase